MTNLGRSLLLALCLRAQAQTVPEILDAYLAKWRQPDAPGMAVLLIHNGRIEYRKTLGLADVAGRRAIEPDTQFLLASMSKQFTAMAVMILATEGKLRLDDPLAKLCPEFPDYAGKITIRQLLHHTSGLPDYEELLVGKFPPDFFRSSKSPPAAREFTARDALEVLSRQPSLRFPPGKKFEYSNSGYVVLGQIIERAAGRRYAEFLKQRIFDPLEMRDTLVVDERKQKPPRLALAYAQTGGKWADITYSPLNSVYGEDGVVTTVEDLYKWDQALYTERLVSRAMLDDAFTSGRDDDGNLTGYGFGWRISSFRGSPMVGHGGSWSGYRTFIARAPARRITAVVLTNSSNPEAPAIALHMIEVGSR